MRRARTRRLSVLAATLLLLASAAPAASQRPPGEPRSDQDRSRLEERIRARMGELIQRRLGLTEDEAEKLSAVAREYEGRRRALAREERDARSRAEALLESGTPDDSAAAALLDHFVALRLREAELVREEHRRLQDVLTPTQVLQLYELRAEIGRRIRAIRSRGGDDRSRRRPGGPPPEHRLEASGGDVPHRRPGGSGGGDPTER